MDADKFAYSEDDLMDVPDIGWALMSLPFVTDIALRLLPCEGPCEHLSCEIDRTSMPCA
jgi:hypothetical protein